MELQLVTYEQAKRLKELGCYIDTTDYYDEGGQLEYDAWYHLSDHFEKHYKNSTNVSAPTVALALKWCRTKLRINIDANKSSNGTWCYKGLVSKLNSKNNPHYTAWFTNYEEAESAALDAALKLLESKD